MRIQKLNSDTKKNLLEDLLKRSPNNYGQYEASVKEILDKADKPLVLYTFGHVNIMYSRRTLLTNFNKLSPMY